MKIKILVPIRHPVGGIRTYLKYTYRKLDRGIYEFAFLAPQKDYLNQIQKDLKGFSVTIIYTGKENSVLSMFTALLKTLSGDKYDIIHSQGFSAGIISALVNFIFRIPHLMTSHDVLRKDQFADNKSYIKKWIISFLLKKITIIQSVSYDAQNNLTEFFPILKKNHEKLIVIKNGIEISEFSTSESTNKNNDPFNRKDEKFIIGFIGRFMPQKGFLYFMDIVKYLKRNTDNDFIIYCVGGYDGYIREYQKRIKKEGLDDYFKFIGFQENVNAIMRRMNVLAIPSLWEACPILPMEAIVCGTPVVAFSCIGLREVLKNTPALLGPEKDWQVMAENIIKIMNDNEKIKNKFSAYIEEGVKKFNVTNTARQLDNIFKQIII